MEMLADSSQIVSGSGSRTCRISKQMAGTPNKRRGIINLWGRKVTRLFSKVKVLISNPFAIYEFWTYFWYYFKVRHFWSQSKGQICTKCIRLGVL